MKIFIWPSIFLILAGIEYYHQQPMCGSAMITGQMWFMWLVMAIATFKFKRLK